MFNKNLNILFKFVYKVFVKQHLIECCEATFDRMLWSNIW